MAYDYFISYRRQSGGIAHARELFHILEQYVNPNKIFWDLESITEGDFRIQIMNGIRECKHFIVLVNDAFYKDLNPEKFKDDLFFEEIKIAAEYQKDITPLIYTDNMLTDEKIKQLLPTFDFSFLRHNMQSIKANSDNDFESKIIKHFQLSDIQTKKEMGQNNTGDNAIQVGGNIGGDIIINNGLKLWHLVVIIILIFGGSVLWKYLPFSWNTSEQWTCGKWRGGNNKNMPNGDVTVVYLTNCEYNTLDLLHRTSKPGYKVVGYYKDGNLIIGDLYDENDNLIKRNFEPEWIITDKWKWKGGDNINIPNGDDVTVIYFTNCVYNSQDPLKRASTPGQKVVGYFENGNLIIGDRYDENDNLIERNFEPKL